MKARPAFTLTELLVALAITSVLVVLLASVVSATMGAWQQGRNRLDTFSNARQLIGRLQDEISGAVASKDHIQFVENATELKGAADPIPKTSENVFFVTPYPNNDAGDLCVVAYRHDAVNHRLERRFKSSAAAWAVAPASRYQVASYPDSTPTEWRVVADGVMEFELRSYSQANIDSGTTPTDSWNSATLGNAEMEGKTPRRITIRLKVVDDRTLVRLATMNPTSAIYTDTMKRAAREFFADFTTPAP